MSLDCCVDAVCTSQCHLFMCSCFGSCPNQQALIYICSSFCWCRLPSSCQAVVLVLGACLCFYLLFAPYIKVGPLALPAASRYMSASVTGASLQPRNCQESCCQSNKINLGSFSWHLTESYESLKIKNKVLLV